MAPPADNGGSTDTFTGTAKAIVDWTGAISNLYGTYQAATAIAQAIGILQDPNQDIVNQLQALRAQIDTVAGNISWHMDEGEREGRLENLRSAVFTTSDTVNSGNTVDWNNLDLNTGQNVSDGMKPVAFERYYVDSETNGTPAYDYVAGPITWKTLIGYSANDLGLDHGFVHDWRLGLPSLTQLIGLRIQLMAMEDPTFTTERRFHNDLTSYHDALKAELDRMNAGIRSAVVKNAPSYPNDGDALYYPNWTFWVSCADIYSGLNDTRVLAFSDTYPLNVSQCITDDGSSGSGVPTYDQACLTQAGTDYTSWYQANVQSVQDQACANVRQQMPLFSTQALIDTLYLFANGITDLTQSDSTIHLSANTSLCLDVPWGSTDPGAQVQIYGCNGDTTSQSWRYDRLNQQIVNAHSGLCLDVRAVSPSLGTPVQTWTCNGGANQKWSYDAQSQVLSNGVGTVLDVPWEQLQPSQVLWTWALNGSDAQRWQ